MALTVGSLFSGIGGFDLGLERAGMVTRWQVEQDEFCLSVLACHFPNAVRHKDVRHVGKANLAPVDVICGGFPCQDLSVSGRGAGIAGPRSGLWSEYARIVGELRPRYVVVENVSALLFRGFELVIADLAALGYDAEWDCLPASAFGAPHRRDRFWMVAYPNGGKKTVRDKRRQTRAVDDGAKGTMADATGITARGTEGERTPKRGPELGFASWWEAEPNVGRVADGIPRRMDRLHALGNALVPQIAEWIGHRIVEDAL